jgi:stage II sporulation protein AA (anti-sigma F factor antagonist)
VTEIRTEHVTAQTIVVAPSGELDLASAIELVDALDSAFATVPSVVLDLSEVTFIDSSIISAVASTNHAVAALPDAQFVVVSPPESRPRRVFEMVGAAQFVRLYDDRSTALASIR